MAPPPPSSSSSPAAAKTYTELLLSKVQSPAFSRSSPQDRINTILSIRSPHDVRFLSKFLENDVRLESINSAATATADGPKTTTAVFNFRVERYYCNGGGNLHGGAAAAMYDVLTSLALQAVASNGEGGGGAAVPELWLNGGVSRTLNVTYLRPAPEGMELRCEVEVVQAGKTLSFLRGRMLRAGDGVLVSVCEHNKAAVMVRGGLGGAEKGKL